eukprot:TRINITY_DN15159_c1_g1_i4.p1 TRINITY_DN15159_c1_g1~~TRINITY_DN15159_c1_g1_i4.p1  ORF type:complete len:203 (+),score=34.14 TRINITY_DN15159_c1_g1_i4:345-953(+)
MLRFIALPLLLVVLAAVRCNAGDEEDEDMWRRFARDLNNPASPLNHEGSIRTMLKLRCESLRHSGSYPDNIPTATVDKLCAKVLGETDRIAASVSPQALFQKLPILIGTIALVLGILWWIWNASSPDAAYVSGMGEPQHFAGPGTVPSGQRAAPPSSQPATEEKTTAPSPPVMPSEQQRAEQRAARLARFSDSAAASSEAEH